MPDNVPNAVAANVLVCLRNSGERLRPVLANARRRRPLLEPLLAPWRILTPLADLPQRLPPWAKYYLPSQLRPNSKAEAVVRELLAAGIVHEAIWTFDQQSDHPLARVGRIALWALRLLPTLAWLALARPLDAADRQVLLGRAAMRLFLHRNPHAMPIIVSDVSPTLHMLWSAAVSLGRPPLWWQDDYHHAGPLPYPVCSAAVLNQGGYAAVMARSPQALIAKRPQAVVNPMRPVPEAPRLGVATNVSFAATPPQMALLASLREAVGAERVHVRLHPNSSLHGRGLSVAWLDIAAADEPMTRFAARLDLVIVGNSAAQLRLLGEGVAVLHVAGLDDHGFDLYGYVRDGFSYGVVRPEDLTLAALNRHYSDASARQRLADFMQVRPVPALPGLAALARLARRHAG